MNINDKIKQILIDKNITPSYFADEIGVQRSSISHILSGRNRPSFDIIQKIIRRFPELGYDWIMEEEQPQPIVRQSYGSVGRPFTSSNANTSVQHTDQAPANTNNGSDSRPFRSEIPEPVPPVSIDTAESVTSPKPLPVPMQTERKAERILIFYTDGTFQEYRPS